MLSDESAQHWDATYAEHGANGVSWSQQDAGPSLSALDALAVDPGTAVIDIGGGTSAFAGGLLDRGFLDVTVLDVSIEAIEAGAKRLGTQHINWQIGDVLEWRADREYGLWHDRATFHFFVEETDRQQYRNALQTAVAPGGAVIIETFALDGPEHCSGLPVARYSTDTLARELGPALTPVASGRYQHHTPAGAAQAFIWLALRKNLCSPSPRR
jgi:trans-aconitate methyltransferase